MPIYEYECVNHHRFELRQGFDAEPQADCPKCNRKARRLLEVPAVIYKGSGFYTTDYARPKPPAEDGAGDKAKPSDGAKPAASKEPAKAPAKTASSSDDK